MIRICTAIFAATEYLYCEGKCKSASKSFPSSTRTWYIKQAPTSNTGLELWTPSEMKGMVICFLVTTAVLGRSFYITRGYGEAVCLYTCNEKLASHPLLLSSEYSHHVVTQDLTLHFIEITKLPSRYSISPPHWYPNSQPSNARELKNILPNHQTGWWATLFVWTTIFVGSSIHIADLWLITNSWHMHSANDENLLSLWPTSMFLFHI